jgi:hypothetical protein
VPKFTHNKKRITITMFRKPVFSYAAVAIAAAVLILAAPRAAHAIAATLVQVNNSAASPAVAQDVSRLASQQVTLTATEAVGPGVNQRLSQVDVTGAVSPDTYVVPAGQTLIITSIDVTPSAPGSGINAVTISNSPPGYQIETFVVTNSVTTMLQFPTGIVFPAGESLVIGSPTFSGGGFFTAFVRGYLTSN